MFRGIERQNPPAAKPSGAVNCYNLKKEGTQMWRQWIKDRGIGVTADILGVSYETVRSWVNDGKLPKDSLKKRLVLLADGAFEFNDFFK